MSSATTTAGHDVIRKWIEERGGPPSRVRGTESKDGTTSRFFRFVRRQ